MVSDVKTSLNSRKTARARLFAVGLIAALASVGATQARAANELERLWSDVWGRHKTPAPQPPKQAPTTSAPSTSAPSTSAPGASPPATSAPAASAPAAPAPAPAAAGEQAQPAPAVQPAPSHAAGPTVPVVLPKVQAVSETLVVTGNA